MLRRNQSTLDKERDWPVFLADWIGAHFMLQQHFCRSPDRSGAIRCTPLCTARFDYLGCSFLK